MPDLGARAFLQVAAIDRLPAVEVGVNRHPVPRNETVLVKVANDPRVLGPDLSLDVAGVIDLDPLARDGVAAR